MSRPQARRAAPDHRFLVGCIMIAAILLLRGIALFA